MTPRTNLAIRRPTAVEIRDAFNSPIGRLLTQIGFALLLGRLRAITHPAARILARILVSITKLEHLPAAREWALKELPKLDRELRKLAKTKPEYAHARVVVQKVTLFLKQLPT